MLTLVKAGSHSFLAGDEFSISDFRFAARLEHLLIEWKLDGTNRKSASSKVT